MATMISKDDMVGITQLLHEHGFPDNEEFVSDVAFRTFPDPDHPWHAQPQEFLNTAEHLQRADIEMEYSFAYATDFYMRQNRTMTRSLEKELDDAADTADAHREQQLEELAERAANARRSQSGASGGSA